jgi:hypothetical protein
MLLKNPGKIGHILHFGVLRTNISRGVKFNKPSCFSSASILSLAGRKFGFQFGGFKVFNGSSNNIKTNRLQF